MMSMMWLLLGCGQEPPLDCGDPEDRRTAVLTSLTFARRADDGTTNGFDLDGIVSDDGDAAGCNHADLVDPFGNEGIDSAFSGLVPTLEATEAAAVEGLIQDSINSGELLLLVDVSRMESSVSDECVDIGLWRGSGTPMVGTDGWLLDGQTFSALSDPPPGLVNAARIEGGVALGSPFEIGLPMQVLDVALEFYMQDAAVSITLHDDGSMSGFFGGAVDKAGILKIVEEDDLGDIAELVSSLVNMSADMFPDENGECQALSVVFEFEATPAFIYEE